MVLLDVAKLVRNLQALSNLPGSKLDGVAKFLKKFPKTRKQKRHDKTILKCRRRRKPAFSLKISQRGLRAGRAARAVQAA
jgi:hypothetical protein